MLRKTERNKCMNKKNHMEVILLDLAAKHLTMIVAKHDAKGGILTLLWTGSGEKLQ